MSTSHPFTVSVIIPAFNSAATVVESVQSALSQTSPPDEVIVVDDGSTDDTPRQIVAFGDRVRYIRQANAGVAAARNRGLSEAQSNWVGFLDSDDVWHPGKLELQGRALDSRPDIVLLGAKIFPWPGVMPSVESAAPVVIPFEQLLLNNLLPTSTVLAKAATLRQVGAFDIELRGAEDWDLWLRVAKIASVAYLPVPLAGYRFETRNSLSKNAGQMERGLRRILDKHRAAGTFARHPILRLQAQAFILYSVGLMYQAGGDTRRATSRFCRSLLTWPLNVPSKKGKTITRLKMLAATLLHLGGPGAS